MTTEGDRRCDAGAADNREHHTGASRRTLEVANSASTSMTVMGKHANGRARLDVASPWPRPTNRAPRADRAPEPVQRLRAVRPTRRRDAFRASGPFVMDRAAGGAGRSREPSLRSRPGTTRPRPRRRAVLEQRATRAPRGDGRRGTDEGATLTRERATRKQAHRNRETGAPRKVPPCGAPTRSKRCAGRRRRTPSESAAACATGAPRSLTCPKGASESRAAAGIRRCRRCAAVGARTRASARTAGRRPEGTRSPARNASPGRPRAGSD